VGEGKFDWQRGIRKGGGVRRVTRIAHKERSADHVLLKDVNGDSKR